MDGGRRLFAVVDPGGLPSSVRHVVGFPREADRESDKRPVLPRARVLVIEEKQDGVFLYRLTESGEYAGDTCYESMDAAKDQAAFEYGECLGAWKTIPDSVPDPYEFALSQMRAGP